MTDSEVLAEILQRLTAIEATLKIRHVGPYEQEERLRKQAKFLEAYNQIQGVTASCKFAGITRETYYAWEKSDEPFRRQVQACRRGEWQKDERG